MEDKDIALVERVLKAIQEEDHQKHTATGIMTAQQLHGLGGVFTQLGAEPEVFSTHVRPQSISNILPMFPSVDEDPRYWTLTGFTAPDGSQPTNACDDAPTGFTKACQLTAYFGLKRFDTQEIEMDKVMLRVNRGDFKDLRLMGNAIIGGTNLMPGGITRDNALNVITKMEMLRTAGYMEMALHNDIWQGTVAAGTFPGLAVQIATGQLDAASGVACPSLDSDIKDFAYNSVCGTGLDIVEYLSAMMYYLESLANSTGMGPVKYVLAMRPQLWFELSACWPCSYLTNRCLNAGRIGQDVVTVQGAEQVSMRDQMRNSKTIPINGIYYDVVLDTGIFEHNNVTNANVPAGSFASTIYAVPLTATGGFPVTYREYVDYRGAAPDEALLRNKQSWFNTDAGSYSWTYLEKRWCYSLSLKTEQRIVLRTPQLAGALQNILYSPLQHLREPDFSNAYHVDGGVSLRTAGTRYAVWAAQGVGR
ncbi:MAG: hypothetical protein EHM35_00020 [Planctomycetaceae bacterium]|nr:MAG: hypothetical protein EHM35_00020 [Planctomycetaceae bacterium]